MQCTYSSHLYQGTSDYRVYEYTQIKLPDNDTVFNRPVLRPICLHVYIINITSYAIKIYTMYIHIIYIHRNVDLKCFTVIENIFSPSNIVFFNKKQFIINCHQSSTIIIQLLIYIIFFSNKKYLQQIP